MQRILESPLGFVRRLGFCLAAGLRAPTAYLLPTMLLCGAQTNAALGQDAISQMYHKSWTTHDGAPDNIDDIVQGADGFLWLATDNGLYHFDGRTFERYTPPNGSSMLSDSLSRVQVTRDGSLWVSYFFGGLTRITQTRTITSSLASSSAR
jgi:ligand-binding sensor domain-containing protein